MALSRIRQTKIKMNWAPRFSLRTLILAVLCLGSAIALYHKQDPWKVKENDPCLN